MWAFANVDPYTLEMFDAPHQTLNDDATQFTLEQRDMEIRFNCYSAAFGPDLLLGMFSLPIDAIPKPHSDKL